MKLVPRNCVSIVSLLMVCSTWECSHSVPSQESKSSHHDEYDPASLHDIDCSDENTVNTCPAWTYCSSRQCTCGDAPYEFVKCSNHSDNLLVMSCCCATFDKISNQTELGHCLLNCERFIDGHDNQVYYRYPNNVSELNDALCGEFNRKGSLCGSCKDGYFPLAYSYNMTCVRCDNTWYKWIEYFAIVYIPLTMFYFVILFFQVNTTSSHLFGFVLYSQVISFPMMCRVTELSFHAGDYFKWPVEIGLSIYGFWNMDFFRILNHSSCLRLSFLSASILDLLSGIYPLLLIIFTYVMVYLYDMNYKPVRTLVKPMHALFRIFKGNFEIKTSLIDAFSTFFLLSNTKLFNVAFDLITPTTLFLLNSSGEVTTSTRLYLDSDIKYFQSNHIPYGILAIAVIFISITLPVLCFALYPLQISQRYLSVLPQHWRIALHTFVDTFQGSFKDGTEPGTRDYRWFSVFYFTIRAFLLLIWSFSSTITFFILASITLALISLAIIALQPYKDFTKHNHHTPLFLLYLSFAYLCLIGRDIGLKFKIDFVIPFEIIGVASSFSPLLYIFILAIHWMVQQKPCTLLKC